MPWKNHSGLYGFYAEGYSQTKNASALCSTHSSRNYVYIFIELTNWREMLSNRYVFHSVFFLFTFMIILLSTFHGSLELFKYLKRYQFYI